MPGFTDEKNRSSGKLTDLSKVTQVVSCMLHYTIKEIYIYTHTYILSSRIIVPDPGHT